MNAEIVNKFLGATTTILTDYFSFQVESGGAPEIIPNNAPLSPVNVLLDMSGDLEGQFVLAYSNEAALGVSRAMMGNPDYPELDDMCTSALSELGNMIGGSTATELAAMGYVCNLAPPIVINMTNGGGEIKFSTPVLLVMPIKTDKGDFKVCIGLKPAD